MEHHTIVNINLEKEEYDQAPPKPRREADKPPPEAGRPSCFVCRKTLLLSYFNCCAVCLGVIECSRPQMSRLPIAADSLPTVEPPRSPQSLCPARETSESSSSSSSLSSSSSSSSSATMVGGRSNDGSSTTTRETAGGRHCDSTYCKYTHLRPLMVFFVLCEFAQFTCFLVSLNMALYCHDWLLLRYAGLILLQWWQIFMLSRQASRRWNSGQSIVAGQVAAAFFMVWYYVESSRQWQWWEPLAICMVLLKIVFPW
ncbi:hypothetical protein GGR53DRAFT_524705 [Hypoxylon sp. FL1150]|nr:hypothetical protein GGR53DRAFT_524705 [Hypoxylon sp. FL1150]